MAKGESTFILRFKTVGNDILKRFRITLGDVTGAIRSMTSGLVSLGKKIVQLAVDASEFDEVKKSFTSLARSQGEDAEKMIQNMRNLSKNTISDLKLMKNANTALLLGLPVDKFGDMLQIARTASKATGQSMEFMLNSIVTGLGRGSKLILDNLGIVINTNKAYEKFAQSLNRTADSLSDSEKKQAFVNEAMKIGIRNAKILGDGQVSLKDKVAQANAGWENLSITIGKKLNPMIERATSFWGGLAAKLNTVFGGTAGPQVNKLTADLAKLKAGRDKLISQSVSMGISEENATAHADARIKKVQDQINVEQKLTEKRTAGLAEIKTLNAETQAENDASEQLAVDTSLAFAEVKKQNEQSFQTAMKDIKLQEQLSLLNQQIANEKDAAKRTLLVKQKAAFKEKVIDDKRKKDKTALAQFQKFIQSAEVKGTQTALGTISGLQSSHNKGLVALGKAAAIANITISTADGVGKAFALGPILGPILAPIVAIAGAAQIAQVSGVKLAEGGIVSARPGGTSAIIGEGGRDEAVVPLDDIGGGGIGGNVTINVQGGMLGDQESAREFAIAVDEQLFQLRKDNSSVAFDTRAV